MSKQIEALKLALEALETLMLERGSIYENAITAIREALADSALDRMAENARDLGLDYEPAQQEPVELDPKDVHVEVVTKQMGGFAPVMTNGVRLTHKPTGTVVEETAERSAHRNRDVAWKKLAKLVASPPTQQQEHVSVMTVLHLKDRTEIGYGPASAGYDLPTGEYKLYTSPQPSKPTGVKPWVGLTSQEVYACADESGLPQELSTGDLQAFGQAIEAKLKEKNA